LVSLRHRLSFWFARDPGVRGGSTLPVLLARLFEIA
jgi:hypothetical protein